MCDSVNEKTLATRIDLFQMVESKQGLEKGIRFILAESWRWGFQAGLMCAEGDGGHIRGLFDGTNILIAC